MSMDGGMSNGMANISLDNPVRAAYPAGLRLVHGHVRLPVTASQFFCVFFFSLLFISSTTKQPGCKTRRATLT